MTMICKRCGAEIPDWFIICGICGTPVNNPLDRKKNKKRSAEEQNEQSDLPRMRPVSHTALRTAAEDPSFSDTVQETDEAEAARIRSFFAWLSVRLGIISLLLLGFPFAAVPVSLMAVLFGIISLRRGEYGIKRAVAGISTGAAAFLLGVVLLVCTAMLGPYLEDLQIMFEEYMRLNMPK